MECAIQVNNAKPAAEEDVDLQPDTQLNMAASSLEIYMNSQRTNLQELLTPGSDHRSVILYPTEITLESQFFANRSLRINDVQVSMVELETSFRQLFHLNLLASKISAEMEPIKQIFQRIGTKTEFKVPKDRVNQ